MQGRVRRQQTAAWLAAVLWALLAAAVGACGEPASGTCGVGGIPPHPEIGGELLFSCSAGIAIKGDLFVLDLSSGQVQRLTTDAGFNTDPAWSPDGRHIAFESTRKGRSDIFLLDVGSGAVTWLTGGTGFNEQPRWSPDGSWISFTSGRDGITEPVGAAGFHRDLYRIRADGSSLRRLTWGGGFNGDAAWSPDGSQMTFTSDRGGAFDLYVMNPDGGDRRQLTHHEGSHGFAAYAGWSPDGTAIVFNATNPPADASQSSIYTLAIPAGKPLRITRGYDYHPDWSRDGAWIAFLGSRGGHSQLFVVRPDGSDLTQLTRDTGDKDVPRWRPS